VGILALIPDNPHPAVPLALADTLDPTPAGQDDIIPHDQGGETAVVPILPELGMQPDIAPATEDYSPVSEDYSPVTEDHSTVTEDQSPVSENHPPVIEDQPTDEPGEEVPVVESPISSPLLTAMRGNVRGTRIQVPTPRVRFAHPHNTRHQMRRNMADHTVTATGIPANTLRLTRSDVESITAFLEQRKREGTLDPSANVSVSQALRTRGNNAERVIIKELTQMDVLGVWQGMRTQHLGAAQRAGIIRSSMFLKRKTHPDGMAHRGTWRKGKSGWEMMY
jgi:hypothetical protein